MVKAPANPKRLPTTEKNDAKKTIYKKTEPAPDREVPSEASQEEDTIDDRDDIIDSYISRENIGGHYDSEYSSSFTQANSAAAPAPLPAGDPYSDKDFKELNTNKRDELKEEMQSYSFEEAKAFRAPLKASDLKSMEKDGKKLYDEIQGGLEKAKAATAHPEP